MLARLRCGRKAGRCRLLDTVRGGTDKHDPHDALPVGGALDCESSMLKSLDPGGVPEWLKGTDCKSVGLAYVGSNPTPSTRSKSGVGNLLSVIGIHRIDLSDY